MGGSRFSHNVGLSSFSAEVKIVIDNLLAQAFEAIASSSGASKCKKRIAKSKLELQGILVRFDHVALDALRWMSCFQSDELYRVMFIGNYLTAFCV